MIKIVFDIEDIKSYQMGDLPKNAAKMNTPVSMEQMMKQASPIAIILCVFMSGIMVGKICMNHAMVISPVFIIVGFGIGFLLLPVHEYLHGIIYPKQAEVTIGKIKKSITFVALASYPLERKRFILMSLLPFVLGIIPLVLFIVSAPDNLIFNGLMFGMACMGMVSPFPDVFNVYLVLKQTNKGDSVMFYEDDMYCISGL